jgi:phosphopantetheinyl transferase
LDSLNEYSFSISHSFPYCTAIISKSSIGIDLEKQGRNVEKILSKFLKEPELKLIEEGVIEGLEAFCMKEAALKTAKGRIKTLKDPILIQSKVKGKIDLKGKSQPILFERIEHEKCLIIASSWKTTF